jgi:ankyrin repeat protein
LRQPGVSLAERNNAGDTALLLAALNGKTETVRWLLSQPGVSLAERDNNGNTALLYAASNGHIKTGLSHLNCGEKR